MCFHGSTVPWRAVQWLLAEPRQRGAAAEAKTARWISAAATIPLQLHREPPSCVQGNIAGMPWSRELFPKSLGGLTAQQSSWWIFRRAELIYVSVKVFP